MTTPGSEHGSLRALPRARRPGSVRLALALGIASAVVGLAVMVLARAMIDTADLRDLQATLTTPGRPVTLEQVAEQVSTIWNWVLLATGVVAAAWLAVLAATYRGGRVARIVLTVMGSIWILLGLPSLGGQMYGGSVTVATVGLDIVLVAGTLAMLYLGSARRYFAPTRYDIHGPG